MGDIKKVILEKTEIYEAIAGADAEERYTHEEIMGRIDEMYECYAYMCEVGDWAKMREVLSGTVYH